MPFTAGLNRMIEPFGFRLEALTIFEVCFHRLLRTHGRFKFVQVGAHDGIQFDGLFRLVTAHRLPGLVLEPLSDLFGRFETGTAGIASLQPHHHLRSGIPAEVMRTEVVPCLPLMEVVEAHGFLDAAYLQIDTEGFDAEVIRMIDFKRFHPALIKFEQESLEGRDLVAIGSLLRNRGYRLHAAGPDAIAVHLS
jgi:hypothetical protein